MHLKTTEFNIVVQINGKKRTLMKTKKELNDKDLINEVRKIKEVENYLKGKKIVKHIYVKNRLINLIIA